MSTSPEFDDALREAIIQRPDVILDDHDLMHALIAANDRTMGSNIVDLRGIAMERLEHRLGRLEDTHRSVIAAAYENLAGTNQVHRAVLSLLEPDSFEAFLNILHDDVAQTLRVESVRLVLESARPEEHPANDVIFHAPPGYVDDYICQGRTSRPQQVTLRLVQQGAELIHGPQADRIRSEACLRLDPGEGCPTGLLVMGAQDPKMFSPQHGTDLLSFFAGVVERTLRRWLT